MAFTRRALLERVGALGGAGAAFMAMEAMGLSWPTPPEAANFALPPGSGAGRSVIILGAGIAGLVSAYELIRAGYRVTVIEARDRIGGRAWSIRGGDRIVQAGRPDQIASFAPGQYFNAGPARIPSTHHAILGYARKFGVAMQPFVNSNRHAKWEFGGKVEREGRMVNDLRGQMNGLLAKAIDQHALDGIASKGEVEMVRQMIAALSSLDAKGNYVPDGRSGYATERGGYGQAGVPLPPLSLTELIPAPAIALPYLFDSIWDMQAVMLQPVGGMDRIAYAFYDQVKPMVRLGQQVKAIRRSGNRVRIEHGADGVSEADYCICTIPMPVLARIPSDFSRAKKAALTSVAYLASVKVAFESARFWETGDSIYGGMAWTDRANENVLYPSADFGAPIGVLVAAYCAGWTSQDNPGAFAALSHEQRFAVCRASVEALHPGEARKLSKPVTVAWGLTPFSEGVAAQWPDFAGNGTEPRGGNYLEALRPEGPILFAGEHLSYVPAWQEGAALSAHAAMGLLDDMVRHGATHAGAAS